MPIHLILDAAVLLIVLIAALRGYHKGIFLTLASIAIVILAYVGAGYAAQIISPKVSDIIEPSIYSLLSSKEEEAPLSDGGGEEPSPEEGESLLSAGLSLFGISAFRAADVTDVAVDAFSGVRDAAMRAASAAFAGSISRFLVVVISFFLLITALNILKNLLNRVLRLPGLNFINRMTGLIAGALLGVFLCFVLVTAIGLFDIAIPATEIQKTVLFRLFADYNFITF
ncbi:CvpA family protein [Oscillospiraceae bacterium OttesenSCG-928-G22]|nr:CvpA family protein [Oscillospiraceae bacterium OttesenSCG-928-G22]